MLGQYDAIDIEKKWRLMFDREGHYQSLMITVYTVYNVYRTYYLFRYHLILYKRLRNRRGDPEWTIY
jgi:hypothetical protein